jgi:hypothetical protein
VGFSLQSCFSLDVVINIDSGECDLSFLFDVNGVGCGIPEVLYAYAMADIQFEEESQYRRPAQFEQKPLFIRLVLATGIISTDKQAKYLLLGIAGVGILFTLFMVFHFGGSASKPAVPSITGAPLSLTP